MSERNELSTRQRKRLEKSAKRKIEKSRSRERRRSGILSGIGRNRFFGAGIGISLIVAGLFVSPLGDPIRKSFAPSSPPNTPSIPTKASPKTGELPNIHPLYAQLLVLDSTISNNPANGGEYARQSAKLATDYFSSELGAPNSQELFDKIIFQSQEEYFGNLQAESGCINNSIGPDQPALNLFSTDRIYVNLDYFLNPVKSKNRSATFIFAAVLHEQHHSRPPVIKLAQPMRIENPTTRGKTRYGTIGKGLSVFSEDLDNSISGRICYAQDFISSEEAVGEDSQKRLSAKIGLNIGSGYDLLVNLYRMNVIIPFYGGNNRVLLEFQQRSDRTGFYSALGEKLGFPVERRAIGASNYLNQILASAMPR